MITRIRDLLIAAGFYVEDDPFQYDRANGDVQCQINMTGIEAIAPNYNAPRYRVSILFLDPFHDPSSDVRTAALALQTAGYVLDGSSSEGIPEDRVRVIHLECYDATG